MGRPKTEPKRSADTPSVEDVQALRAEFGYTERTAVIIHAKQACLDWVNQKMEPGLFPNGLTLEQVNDEPPVFLIPLEENVTHADKWVKRNWKVLFMEALDGWETDPEAWPKERTWAMFKKWFRWEWSSEVREVGKDLEPDL